jgi:hypothetical protein
LKGSFVGVLTHLFTDAALAARYHETEAVRRAGIEWFILRGRGGEKAVG